MKWSRYSLRATMLFGVELLAAVGWRWIQREEKAHFQKVGLKAMAAAETIAAVRDDRPA